MSGAPAAGAGGGRDRSGHLVERLAVDDRRPVRRGADRHLRRGRPRAPRPPLRRALARTDLSTPSAGPPTRSSPPPRASAPPQLAALARELEADGPGREPRRGARPARTEPTRRTGTSAAARALGDLRRDLLRLAASDRRAPRRRRQPGEPPAPRARARAARARGHVRGERPVEALRDPRANDAWIWCCSISRCRRWTAIRRWKRWPPTRTSATSRS